jgi:uncharacterized phage protein gp47/JayE
MKIKAFVARFIMCSFVVLLLSTTTLTNVTGVSYYDAANKKIYAGIAGNVAGVCTGADAGSTCNTCTDTNLVIKTVSIPT